MAISSKDSPFFRGSELGTSVHGQASGATAKAIPFGSVFSAMAIFAVQLVLVLSTVGGVQHFTAKSCVGTEYQKSTFISTFLLNTVLKNPTRSV